MSTGLIVALDEPDLPKAEHLAKQLAGKVSAFKVGLTFFAAYGPEAIREIGQHAPIFCDLKLHDIPAQVGSAAEELTRLGVWMFTVHASGGPAMITAAAKAAKSVNGAVKATDRPLVAAVTVLTSIDEETLDSVGQGADAAAQVSRLAKLAFDAGATALVCSPLEVASLRQIFGPEVVLVVPGIRPANASADDQARVLTPAQAAEAGASYIVVGRPITAAPDPVQATEEILAELGSR
ncbi:MAG: orotidine-5'-phosphate decarboxylase [Actinomycetota bacterium]|nr:orotidine-5'-phosphate decarboxylase [Actinomycetota bacterium]